MDEIDHIFIPESPLTVLESFSERGFSIVLLVPSFFVSLLLDRHVFKEGLLEDLGRVKAEEEGRNHEDGSLKATDVADQDQKGVHLALVFVLLSRQFEFNYASWLP